MKTILVTAALAVTALPAFAQDCGKWGHSNMSAMAPEQSVPAEDVLVATVDCSTLTGEAQAACEAAQSAK